MKIQLSEVICKGEKQMEEIRIRNQEELVSLDISEVTEQRLLELFLDKPRGTVYVTNDSFLIGIITLGNFRRSQINGRELINKRFITVKETDENKILQIFADRKNINAIPVVDETNRIVKEYYRYNDEIELKNNRIPLSIVKQIYHEVVLMPYEVIIFVLDTLSDNEHEETTIDIYNKSTNKQILIVDHLSLFEIKTLAEEKHVYIYDLCDEQRYKIRSLFYKKYYIDNTGYDVDRKKFLSYVKNIASLFNEFGVIRAEGISSSFIESCTGRGIGLNMEFLKWNNEYDCYEYTKEVEPKIEIVFSFLAISKNPFIMVNKKLIPFIIIFDINTVDYKGIDWDIAYNIIPILKKNGIKCIVLNAPLNEMNEVNSFLDKDIKKKESGSEDYLKFWEYDEEKASKLRRIFIGINKKGYLEIDNIEKENVHYINGERFTYGNPVKYKNTLYLFGPCLVLETCVEDLYTIGSYLRTKVENEYYIENRGNIWSSMNLVMRQRIYKPGDIVIVVAKNPEAYQKNGIKVHSIIDAYKKMPDMQNNVWDSLLHCNRIATKYVTDEIYNILIKQGIFKTTIPLETIKTVKFYYEKTNMTDNDINENLREWLQTVRSFKNKTAKNAGTIVMNCNPFTLGHRYLIEEARKQVDFLYIFVVEEDKSYFKFSDRFEMVKQGVADLDKIAVLPSGRFIISTSTLPGYFDKDKLQYCNLDASEDIELFGSVIAKQFDIKVRFAGEEPLDQFTRQYNHAMSKSLPEYGIRFVEIPRKCSGNEVISASRVRACMKENNYDAIKELVPTTTYKYLMKYYQNN